nr:MAG TPA: hypothetical protein [Bacteriophage sp.]
MARHVMSDKKSDVVAACIQGIKVRQAGCVEAVWTRGLIWPPSNLQTPVLN